MKSFHSSDQTASVASWQPFEFTKPEAQAPAVKPEEIMAIFHSDTPLPQAPANGPKKIKESTMGQAWLPADLPPYTPTVQAFQPKPVNFPKTPAQPESRRTPDAAVVQATREKVNQLLEEAHNTRAEALRMMEEARQQTQEMIQNAQQEAENRLQQAYEIGKSQAQAEYASLVQTAKDMLNQTDAWQADVLAQSETTVIGMLKEMAATLFGEGIVLDPKVLQEVFSRALMKARTMGSLRIFVNPQDAAQLDADWRDFQSSISGQRIQIVPTDSIHPGGCFIEGDHGAVDARIETRMSAVMNVFETQTEE